MCGYHWRHETTRVVATAGSATFAPDGPVSERDRDAAVTQLRENVGTGRLGLDDFETKVEAVFAARTGAELAQVLHGLPRVVPLSERRTRVRAAVTPYLGVMALLVGIWLIVGVTAGFGFPWFVWPMLGWGIPVALSTAHDRRALRLARAGV